MSCGSGFGGVSDKAAVRDIANSLEGQSTDIEATCESAVHDRHTVAVAAVWPGAIVGVVGAGTLLAGIARAHSASRRRAPSW